MAIKIIETKPDAEVVKRVVCRNCGVKLEYVPSDVKSYSKTDYSGCSDTYYFIECPACLDNVMLDGR